ncbi:hypothetical protein H310_03966 [Aphanomyces invadans]|uniref:Uncharacterized protein n=1 Tax=Aphanomyces invadans TaxID=157072 RepID=A0A024UGU0_9STRA|nr:hypothetical protein H310_03966 [Aphanomyces invadans]ETW04843.1 hypothetical protein H310_03966 [Aphanomyces invadans]|eukprot:XP_008866281.1 hypothetical protein H310_03966 [Aphanomyces invadans]
MENKHEFSLTVKQRIHCVDPDCAPLFIKNKKVIVEGFDGHSSGPQQVKEVQGSIKFNGWKFPNMPFTEWDLGEKNFDAILGQPWFVRYNPLIDRRSHKILSINGAETIDQANNGWILKIFSVKEAQKQVEPMIQDVLDEFKDVFPKELPAELPPERGIEFDMPMRPDAKPQYRPPFRLSKVERTSLEQLHRRPQTQRMDSAIEQ